ncbi:G-protein coupled receptor 4-like [Oncorhynchus kisutch]|uniref:G-protein coupled receptor 4-like n=1 Tax=Oncorhynchus kisutch TaxID=8019 RepID=UPI0012DD6231|nr:G-protein coupled receptor 4-like [Oncorhynchus kisutch]
MDPTAVPLNQTNSNLSDSACIKNDWVDGHMYLAAYSLFFIMGFPANCLSLYVAWVLMRKGNNLAVYLVNLSISDLLYTVSLPVWIELALGRPVGDTFCSLVSVVMYNSFYIGSGLLCCISVDRYLAVVYPLYFNWVRQVRTAVAVCAALWCVELSIHIYLLHQKGALQDFSARRLCKEGMPMAQADAHVALTRVVLGFLLPLLIMTFCFHQIVLALRDSTSLLARERRKVSLLLLLLLLTYVVAFAPFQAVMFLRGVLEPGECSMAVKLRDPYMVLVAWTTLNSMLDPIFYCLISQSAKNEMTKVLQRCNRCSSQLKKCKTIYTIT